MLACALLLTLTAAPVAASEVPATTEKSNADKAKEIGRAHV